MDATADPVSKLSLHLDRRLFPARLGPHPANRRFPAGGLHQPRCSEAYRVLLDTTAAIRSALTHLSELGHRRVAYVGGPPQSWANKQRRSAVDNFSKVHALEVTHFSADPGTYEVAKALSDSVTAFGVTAVIAFDDLIAQGPMGGFAAAGVDVPKDLSVIGCDDTLVLRGTTGAVRPTSSSLTLEPELDHPSPRIVQAGHGSDS
ncbi:substrate-binding domain-containing protein [Arthrobacter bambusae]|uniref:substrate-binding domain-containing protein n=1 Tax=Arthrobacter bambusae TaxID=1338426 RepID=UPI00278776D5|nr:substrate-binding domain-containing protein [Arthrobacter bambusae]MDQ0209565.1 DNA-binding LacI/PurR family transcriptional regulator [Arthrobacter bambusae]MDQ0234109.1 DNA-binding LacI/PurR family transcriptional regulator [Arthrobacter bambusae]